VVPSTPGAVGQTKVVTSTSTDANGHQILNEIWGSTGTSQVIQVNGTPIITESPANFQNTSSVTVTNPSAGNIQMTTAVPYSTLGTPTLQTPTNQNAAGARSITYLVIGCQDGATCSMHSPQSATQTIANANASPQVLLTIAPIYGYRCFNVYVTADSGGRTTGLVAGCVWTQFLDTGTAGDTTTAPSTNTTQIWTTSKPLIAACGVELGGLGDIDHPPCTPNANDDEFTSTHGLADAADPFWKSQSADSPTFTLTNGMLNIANANTGTNRLECAIHPLPSPPYTFVILVYYELTSAAGSSQPVSIGFFETASGKFLTEDILTNQGLTVSRWTSDTTYGSTVQNNGGTAWISLPLNFRIRRSGTSIFIDHSQDGVIYTPDYAELITTTFTTAPDNIAICLNPHNATTTTLNVEYKYVRETQ
jgi:hypothetical protein